MWNPPLNHNELLANISHSSCSVSKRDKSTSEGHLIEIVNYLETFSILFSTIYVYFRKVVQEPHVCAEQLNCPLSFRNILQVLQSLFSRIFYMFHPFLIVTLRCYLYNYYNGQKHYLTLKKETQFFMRKWV